MMHAYNVQKIKEQIPKEWAKLEKHLKEKQNISMEDFFDDSEGQARIIEITKRKVKNFKL